jgi:hypothetical protein
VLVDVKSHQHRNVIRRDLLLENTRATLIVARVVVAMSTTIVKTITLVDNVILTMVNSKSMEFVPMIVVSWRVSIEF